MWQGDQGGFDTHPDKNETNLAMDKSLIAFKMNPRSQCNDINYNVMINLGIIIVVFTSLCVFRPRYHINIIVWFTWGFSHDITVDCCNICHTPTKTTNGLFSCRACGDVSGPRMANKIIPSLGPIVVFVSIYQLQYVNISPYTHTHIYIEQIFSWRRYYMWFRHASVFSLHHIYFLSTGYHTVSRI